MIATPDHRAAPIASKRTNCHGGRRTMPAMAVATEANPGMNLATISDGAPQRAKMVSVWRTHESGDNDMRHSVFSTRPPSRRPATYQAMLPMIDAATAVPSRPKSEYGLRAARALVTISVG